MYERFSDCARKVMQLSFQEAMRLDHEYLGTEHLLLGLVKEGSGLAANVLSHFGVQLHSIRLEVEKLVHPGPNIVTMRKLLKTPQTEKVLRYAIEESRKLGQDLVGSEHILLGLLHEQDGVGAQVLLNFGLNGEKVRKEVMNRLNSGANDEDPIPNRQNKLSADEISQKITESALEEARIMRHDYVGGEHFLLALFHDQESVVARVLDRLGLKINDVRTEILRVIAENKLS
jgi:ATP-dependent Clp protease ATP-binding subunit ClpC